MVGPEFPAVVPGDVADAQEPGARGEEAPDSGHGVRARVQVDFADDDSEAVAEHVPGDDVGRVLGVGEDDLVALAPVEAPGDDGNAFRGAVGKRDLVRPGTEGAAQLLPQIGFDPGHPGGDLRGRGALVLESQLPFHFLDDRIRGGADSSGLEVAACDRSRNLPAGTGDPAGRVRLRGSEAGHRNGGKAQQKPSAPLVRQDGLRSPFRGTRR